MNCSVRLNFCGKILSMEDTKQEIYKISVRELVEFVYRSGDLDNRRGGPSDLNAMQEGARIHRLLQLKEGPEYRAEVPLKKEIPCGEYGILLEGRADGIIEDENGITVDEIKGMYTDVLAMKESVPVHLAQAKCYGAMIMEDPEVSELGVRMTYCNLETEEIKRFSYSFTREKLLDWFEETIRLYRKWTDLDQENRKAMMASIRGLEFPFAYRPGQRDLVIGVYRTITREKLLFLQAPTGVGKTISTVFPAVKAVGEGLVKRIFYLTAKTVTSRAASDALNKLRESGLRMKEIRLTAKEKICPCEETDCNPVHCPYAKGHFDRVNEAVYLLLKEKDVFNREELLAQAQKHEVCPFEMGLDLALWCTAIIGDYNYAFDPNAKLKRFFSGGQAKEDVLLIDEAHNLVDRGRDMFSADILKSDFLTAKGLIKNVSVSIVKTLGQCNRDMLKLKKTHETLEVTEDLSVFLTHARNLSMKIEKLLAKNIDFPEKKDFLSFYFKLRDFLLASERADDHYLTLAGPRQKDFCVQYMCVDPSKDLQECLDPSKAAVFFSATLLPVNYYKKLLCMEEEPYAVYAKSVFSPENRFISVASEVTTKYTRRGPAEYSRIAAILRRFTEGKKGNYMAFFPSYKVMEEVEAFLLPMAGEELEILCQTQNMKEAEREEFLVKFSEDPDRTRLGLCVLGGIFGEGIDLAGDRLIGAAVVGTGLPQVSEERELLKTYFDERDMDGFSYAYRYPGMNKVLQAAGRVIRTEEDRGVILLMDERFLQSENKKIFPLEWGNVRAFRAEELEERLKEFWNA